jgi:hypothetical protein
MRKLYTILFIFSFLHGNGQPFREKYTLPKYSDFHSGTGYYTTIGYIGYTETVRVRMFFKDSTSEEGFKKVWHYRNRYYDARNIKLAKKEGWSFYHTDNSRVRRKVKYYQLL